MKKRDDGEPSAALEVPHLEAPRPGVPRLGSLIEERRRAAGLTQRELAGLSGVSVGAIRDLEQGRTSWPRRGGAQSLARVLGIGPERLAAGGPAQEGPRPHAVTDVRVLVLGALAASHGGSPADLGAERQRAVLALLALNAGRPVHRTTIIDAIWGDNPPPTAVSMVQSHVSRLRDALEGTGGRVTGRRGGLLTSAGESYLLAVGPGQLDALEFAAQAARGRDLAAAGDTAGACEVYEQALGLWRGHPVADVGLLREHPAVTGLARRRTEVALEFADAAAGAGSPQRALEQLQALAEREPLDERAHAKLMLALAATGQQAAALRAFARIRTRLGRELGVAPGPELADAHLRILRGQAGGQQDSGSRAGGEDTGPGGADSPDGLRAAQRRSRPGSAVVLPRQLPSGVRHFTGRGSELKALWETLEQVAGRPGTVVISAIGGMAGVGKTSLAIQWARQAAARFPDGQLFVDLRGFGPAGQPADPARVIGAFLASLGVPATQIPADPPAQAALFRSVLADKQLLIVLDNARDPEQVRPLLPGSPGCLVLVTSRTRLTGLAAADGATVIDLDTLDHADARELLAARIGDKRLTAEAAAASELIELCGRLPLALAITAARAASRPAFPLATLVTELAGEAGRLDAFDTGEAASSIRQVFSWSCRQLSGPAAAMFRFLGIHPGPAITVAAAASLAGVSRDAARRSLTELADAHLLGETKPGRYTLHDLLRAYASELAAAADPQPARRAALGRVLDHYLRTADAAAHRLSPLRPPIALPPERAGAIPERVDDADEAMAWFEAEDRVLASAVARAAEDGFDAYAWQLVWATTTFLDRQGRWQDLATGHQAALQAAERLGDLAGQGIARIHLSLACMRRSEYEQAHAHLTACIGIYQDLGDRSGEALAHQTMAGVYAQQGRLADAIDHTEQVLALAQATGNRIQEAQNLNNAGWFHAQAGDYRRAQGLCRRALVMNRELGDRNCEAYTLDSLGYVERKLGDLAESADCYRQAAVILREVGHPYFETKILTHLGDVAHEGGDGATAREAWEQALGILDDLGHPDAEEVRARLSGEGG